MRTLIADDNAGCLLFLREALRCYGTPDVAVNGKEAVEAVRAALATDHPYDSICLDLLMPEMGGHEALQAIRWLEAATGFSGRYRTPIIMITGLADEATVKDARKAQCDSFLVKPFERSKLMEELRKLGLLN